MRLAAILTGVVGLLCVVGSIAWMIGSMLSTVSAAYNVDSPGQAAPSSDGLPIVSALNMTVLGVILIVVGVVLLLASNRSKPRF